MLAAEKLEVVLEAAESPRRGEANAKPAIKPSSVPRAKYKPRFYKIVMVLMICAIFAGGVHFYSLAVGITTKGYELNKLKAEVKELAITNESGFLRKSGSHCRCGAWYEETFSGRLFVIGGRHQLE